MQGWQNSVNCFKILYLHKNWCYFTNRKSSRKHIIGSYMTNRELAVFDGETAVSRIFVSETWEGFERCFREARPVFFVYDRNVEHVVSIIETMVRPEAKLPLDVGEDVKTVDAAVKICTWLLDAGADRNSLVLAVGGGILTDMAGFAAAIYKRGVSVAYIPTTLLAQVDASLGGKTGVNLNSYKNILGVVRQPDFTYVCTETLLSLSRRDLLSGVAEMLKTFIIGESWCYEKAVAFFSAEACLCKSGVSEMTGLIYAAAGVKASIVSEDQFENGSRRILNLGHTFAHAIEWCEHSSGKYSGTDLSHGQAVAIGIVLAARLSEMLGLAEMGLAEKLKADFMSCGLPVESPFPISELAEAMEKDKKAEGGMVNFVLIEKIGKVIVKPLSVSEVVKKIKKYDLYNFAE